MQFRGFGLLDTLRLKAGARPALRMFVMVAKAKGDDGLERGWDESR